MNTRSFCAALLITAVIMVPAADAPVRAATRLLPLRSPNPKNRTSRSPPYRQSTWPAVGLYIAQDEGLFARQGLHVTIEKIPSSQAIIAGQLKGQIDISAGSYVAYISAQAGWVAWA